MRRILTPINNCLPIYAVIISLIGVSLLTNCIQVKVLAPTPSDQASDIVYQNNKLSRHYNDSIYMEGLSCKNGQLGILQFPKDFKNPIIQFHYEGAIIKNKQINIATQFAIPLPTVLKVDQELKNILISPNCLGNQTDKTNYYNKVNINFVNQIDNQSYEFSFLMGCDKGGRNKKFEIGYILIAFINAAITIGVALHSRIWSIRFEGRPLSIELKWSRFTVIMLVIFILVIVLYVYARDQFSNANKVLTYIGLIMSYIFCFICADQIFFLIRVFKREVYRRIRICDIMSFIAATGMFVVGFFVTNWIYYDILALSICVGAIKLLRFRNMKQAYLSMATTVVLVTIGAVVFHYTLQKSYNDYAGELASPLFIQIPDLVQELYKKCSWLPVLDVIVPGVFLSFLRTYDENYSTGWGGVYTVVGNLSFIISTFLWIILQAIYPYSIPFSLITYFFLGFAIWIISRKRNELNTLWEGRFNGANNELTFNLINNGEAERVSFGKMVTADIISQIKVDLNDENLHLQQSNSTTKPMKSQP